MTQGVMEYAVYNDFWSQCVVYTTADDAGSKLNMFVSKYKQ